MGDARPPAQGAPRPRVAVVHWNAQELPAKVEAVGVAGGEVVAAEADDGGRILRSVRELGPDALVVWLSWKPSHGRITAAAVRSMAWGRRLPILFVDGDGAACPAAELARTKDAVQGALFVTPANLAFWLRRVADMAAQAAKASA